MRYSSWDLKKEVGPNHAMVEEEKGVDRVELLKTMSKVGSTRTRRSVTIFVLQIPRLILIPLKNIAHIFGSIFLVFLSGKDQ